MEVFATEGPCPACHRPSDKLQLSVLSRAGATATAGYSASQAYERKMRTSTDACRAKASSFSPWLQRLLGADIEVAEAQVRKLAAALARHNGQEEGEAISHTWSWLGVLLQRGNAAMMANMIPESEKPRRHVGIADRKVFARLESFCAYPQNWLKINSKHSISLEGFQTV